jgi:hypothetical protein
MLFFERHFLRISRFFIIFLRNVVVVVLEAHARCHSLRMVLQNLLITKKLRH